MAKKNIIGSFGVKGLSIINGFLLVSVTLNYLDKERYGIWLVFASFISWIGFFEVGLGKGLRNKLTAAIAVKDYELGKKLVSTTYSLLAIILFSLNLVFIFANQFINWHSVLNISDSNISDLNLIALIAISGFFVRFYVQIINNVLYADQRPAIANAISPIANLISLIIIYILQFYDPDGNLLTLTWIMVLSPILLLTIASIIAFSGKYRMISPSIRAIDFSLSNELLSLGIKFFIISISGLILYQTSNILIAQYFGPEEVTTYNIAYKFFKTIQMIFTIMITPFWAAFTDAWTMKDIKWIRNVVKKVNKVWLFVTIIGIGALLASNTIYKFWVGSEIQVPFVLSLFVFLFFIYMSYGAIYCQFVNGLGKLKLQIVASIIGALIFIPLNYILIKKFHMGIEGIVISSIVCNFYGPILGPIQYKKLINGKAKGIWDK